MDLNEFEEAVREAIMTVPARFRDKMDNVAFVIEDQPRQPRQREDPIMARGILLGLYQGVPFGSRGPHYSGAIPDKITLFKSAIELVAGSDPAHLRRQIRLTVWHEIGHYFGMTEVQIRHWEQRRQKRISPAPQR